MAAPLMIAFNKGQLRRCSSPQPHYGLSALQQHLQICLPAFISPNVLNYLVEHFGIAPITTPEADLKVLLKR